MVRPWTAGFHTQLTEDEALLFIQPLILFPFAKKVTLPGVLTVAFIWLLLPFSAVTRLVLSAMFIVAGASITRVIL